MKTPDVENLPVTRGVWLVVACCGCTAVMDGFIAMSGSAAVTMADGGASFTALQAGLFAGLYMLGICVAALLFSRVGDRFGRVRTFRLTGVFILALALVQLASTNPAVIIASRFLMGMALGADYPCVNALAAEYSPGRVRARSMMLLMFAWYIGGILGSLAGFVLYPLAGARHLVMGSVGILAALVFFARLGVPESPRWLAAQGRTDEAVASIRKVFGADVPIEYIEVNAALVDSKGARRMLFGNPGYRRRFAFVAAFWICQTMPANAVFMFAPTILQSFGLGSGQMSIVGSAVISLVSMLGIVAPLVIAERMKRLRALIVTYVFMTAAFFLLGVFVSAPVWAICVLFAVYSFAYGWQTVMENVYPAELFPTEIRATAMGRLTALARFAAAAATFLLPLGLSAFGLGAIMYIAAGISALGLAASALLGEETQGKTLEEASRLV